MAGKLVMSQMDTSLILATLPSQSTVWRSRSVRVPMGSMTKSVRSKRQRTGIVRASGMAEPESTGTGGSGMVDANMMVLRKRIQSLRIQESCYDTPAEWMEWERSAYSSYRADICLLLSSVQSKLLTLRPSVVLSVVSVLMAVLPMASILFLTAVGTQLWTIHCALLDLIPASQ